MLTNLSAHWKYLRYVCRHKYYVYLACRELRVSFWQSIVHDFSKFRSSEWIAYANYFYGGPKTGDTVYCVFDNTGYYATVVETVTINKKIEYRVQSIETSDSAVLRRPFIVTPEEIEERIEAKRAFDIAWNHHQKRNPHHWQYWLLVRDDGTKDALRMPIRYAREMVADWVGAGRAITGKIEVWAWYEKNRDKIILEHETCVRVEVYIEQLRRKYETCKPSATSTTTPSD